MKNPQKLWRILRYLAFGLAALLTLLALVLAGISYQGRREWSQMKNDLLARGEKLTLIELAPAEIPEGQNYYADPLWAEIIVPAGPKATSKSPVPKGERQLDKIDRKLTESEIASLKSTLPEFPDLTTKTSQGLIREAWIKARKGSADDRQRAAKLTLALQPVSEPAISRITELSQRPGARFPVRYEDNFSASLEHVTYQLKLAQILNFLARAKIEQGDGAAARKNVDTMLSLSQTMAFEPLLISLLVRTSIENIALSVINDGIKAHAWTDEDLAGFEGQLSNVRLGDEFAFVLRGERGGFNQFLDYLSQPGIDPVKILNAALSPETEVKQKWAGLLGIGYLKVFSPGDRAAYNRIIQEWIEAADASGEKGLGPRQFSDRKIKELSASLPWKVTHILTSIAVPSIGAAAQKISQTMDQIAQTRIACALERYRLKNGSYPESLDGLVPEYLSTIPTDIITLKPMHYRKIEPDKFLLWSVGWNESDENGVAEKKATEGDWVWGESSR